MTYKFHPMLGPAEEFEPSTPEWAERMSSRLQWTVEYSSESGIRPVIEVLRQALPHKPWLKFPKKKPVREPTAYIRLLLDTNWETVITMIEAVDPNEARWVRAQVGKAQAETVKSGGNNNPQGSNQHKAVSEVDNVDNINIDHPRGGTGATYLLRRLGKKHPDILKRYEKGEFKSVRQAAIAAGIVKVPTAFDTLQSTWRKANKRERKRFLKWVEKDSV